jgi:hypothetical protein
MVKSVIEFLPSSECHLKCLQADAGYSAATPP